LSDAPTILDLYPHRIDVTDPSRFVPRTRCWRWRMKGKKRNSYGHVHYNGRTVRAHRLSLSLKLGIDPANLVLLEDCEKRTMVCHTCNNPWCVNPEHLFLGNAAENAADRIKWQTDLSLDDINEIRNSDLPTYVLAKHWHLSRKLIDRIRPSRRVAIKHLVHRKLNNSLRYTRVP
jgi:hypothetical protein